MIVVMLLNLAKKIVAIVSWFYGTIRVLDCDTIQSSPAPARLGY